MRKRNWLFALAVFLAAFSLVQAQQLGQAKGDKLSQLPPEKAAGQAPLIMGYDIAPLGADSLGKPGDAISQLYPTNSSLGYKGVVTGNFNSADAADEIVADFGATGLWYYDNGSWSQISGLNADSIIGALTINTADDEIVADFGATGLWYWDGINWFQLSGVNATGLFATDDDNDGADEIQVDFAALGVWRFDFDSFNTANWIQLSGLNPYNGLQMDFYQYGYQEGVWSFPTYGVWNIYAGSVFTQLTGTINTNDDHVSAQITNTAGAEDLVMDFGTLGIWLYKQDGSGWVQISTMSPNRVKEVKFVGGQDYELLVDDNDGGLYWGNWNGSTFLWHLITSEGIGPGGVETFDRDGADSGDEEVIIPAAAGGAYIFDYSAGSTFNQWIAVGTNWHINLMVKGDYYDRGYDSTLAVVFSATSDNPGLWLWDQAAGWSKISSVVPDGLY